MRLYFYTIISLKTVTVILPNNKIMKNNVVIGYKVEKSQKMTFKPYV